MMMIARGELNEFTKLTRSTVVVLLKVYSKKKNGTQLNKSIPWKLKPI